MNYKNFLLEKEWDQKLEELTTYKKLWKLFCRYRYKFEFSEMDLENKREE